MKSKYLIYFFIILSILLLVSLYMIEIPSPSNQIVEDYNLEIK